MNPEVTDRISLMRQLAPKVRLSLLSVGIRCGVASVPTQYLHEFWGYELWSLHLVAVLCPLRDLPIPVPNTVLKGSSAREIVHLRGDGTWAALTSVCFKCTCLVLCDQLKIETPTCTFSLTICK